MRFAEFQQLVRLCCPGGVDRAEALMGAGCQFVTDVSVPEGVAVVAWLDKPRAERWLHIRGFRGGTFKPKRGRIRQLADVAAGITVPVYRSASGPDLPAFD